MAIPRSAPPIPPAPPAFGGPQQAPSAAPPPIPPMPSAASGMTPPPPPPTRMAPPPPPTSQVASPPHALQQMELPFALEEEEEAVTNQVAPVQSGGAMQTSSGGRGDILKVAESYGFTGLDLNAFGVMPTISLKDGQFQTGDGAITLGESFLCHLYGGRPKHVYKTDLAQNDPRAEVIYSFDQQVSTGGASIKDKISKWEAAGIPWSRKDYVDVRIGIIRDQDNPEPLLALLSVPPTSVSGYTNISLQLMNWAQMTGGQPGERLVRVWKGPKITKVKFPFHPIKFELMPG